MKIPKENPPDYSPSAVHRWCVPAHLAGRRLDQALAELCPAHSRSRLQAWVKAGRLQVDGVVVLEAKKKLHGGEHIVLAEEDDPQTLADQPEDIPLPIVFEDESMLVIDKPPGLVVHPGSGNWQGTLMNALLHHAPALAGVPRAGIVHRLDKETSGLLAVAKTLAAQTGLVRQLQARTVRRQYLALAAGEVPRDGMVAGAIGRHPAQRTKMAVVAENAGGKPAITHFRVLERLPGTTLLECRLETGRTHQIRVHMASLGHPLVGDPVYGKGRANLPSFHRQALHAARLGLAHPVSGQAMAWESPLPADFRQLLERLRDG